MEPRDANQFSRQNENVYASAGYNSASHFPSALQQIFIVFCFVQLSAQLQFDVDSGPP